MEDWILVNRNFPSREQALNAAVIINTTESRLLSVPKGPQYDVETEVFETQSGWQVKWRKVFLGYHSGCNNCNSCGTHVELPKKGVEMGKVIELKRKPKVKK